MSILFSTSIYKENTNKVNLLIQEITVDNITSVKSEKKPILKISSIRFLSFCSGQESQSKGIELRSQLTKPNNCGGGDTKIELYFHYHFHHNHL